MLLYVPLLQRQRRKSRSATREQQLAVNRPHPNTEGLNSTHSVRGVEPIRHVNDIYHLERRFLL